MEHQLARRVSSPALLGMEAMLKVVCPGQMNWQRSTAKPDTGWADRWEICWRRRVSATAIRPHSCAVIAG